MRRGFAALSVSLPVLIASSLAAHQIGYFVENPDGAARAANLASDGHSYFSDWAFMLTAALTVLGVGCLLALHKSVSGGKVGPPSARAFGLSPLAVFLVQEASERAAAGDLGTGMFEVSVIAGALLQIPFGLLAFIIARAILRTAGRVGQLIQRFVRAGQKLRPSLTIRLGGDWGPVLGRDVWIRQSSPRGPPPLSAAVV